MKRAALIRPLLAPAACAIALAAGGCAGGDNFFSPGKDGSGSAFGNLIAFNTTKPGPLPKPATREDPLQCPTIEVLDGTAASRTYVGTEQTSNNVRYQFSIGDVARECTKAGDQILIKVGVEGRVLLGPAGAPGAFAVPVRIAVRRDKDQKAAAAKLYQVSATIAPGEDQTSFQLVSDQLSVPFTQSHADDDYTILVGFDEQAKAGPPDAKAKSGRKKAVQG